MKQYIRNLVKGIQFPYLANKIVFNSWKKYNLIEYIEFWKFKKKKWKRVSRSAASGDRALGHGRGGWGNFTGIRWGRPLVYFRGALFLGNDCGCQIIHVDHHHMRVYLLGQLCHAGAVLPLFITIIIVLLLGRGLNGRIIWQGFLI